MKSSWSSSRRSVLLLWLSLFLLGCGLVQLSSGRSLEILKDVLCISSHTDFKAEHSLTKPYHQTSSAGWDIPNWDYEGNVVITKDFIRLNQNKPGQFGLIWNTEPMRMKTWEVKLQLNIHGETQNNDTKKQETEDKNVDKWGDGLVFWYTNSSKLQHGPLFGSQDYFSGFGIVIEKDAGEGSTGILNNQTNDKVFIYPIINNGTRKFEGYLEKYRVSDPDSNMGCVARLRNPVHETWIRIRYAHNTLSVWVKGEKKPTGSGYSSSKPGKEEWMTCLALKEVKIPDSPSYFIGVSGATSNHGSETNSDVHDLVSLHTYEIEYEGRQIQEIESGDDPRQFTMPETILFVHPPVIPPTPGLSANVLVVPLVVLLVLVALCVAGTQMYPNPTDSSPYGQRRFH